MRFIRSVFVLGSLFGWSAFSLDASVPYFEAPPEFNSHLTGGYRNDDLKFHIGAAEGRGKNFSKVQLKDLQIAQVGGVVNYSTCHNYYMRANADYGRILRGSVDVRNKFAFQRRERIRRQHHHRHGHHKRHSSLHEHPHLRGFRQPHYREWTIFEHSKQTGNVDKGFVSDFSGGFGWKVVSNDSRVWIAGLIGYSYDRQQVKLLDFKQKEDNGGIVPPGALCGLKGSYITRWAGPWAGIDFSTMVECNVTIFGTAEWHICDFRAHGNWKLPKLFSAQFDHHARGYGFVGTFGFDWAPWDRWGIGLIGSYQQWSTRKGGNHASIHSNLPEGDHLVETFPVAKKSKLERVSWVSYSISLVTSYRF